LLIFLYQKSLSLMNKILLSPLYECENMY